MNPRLAFTAVATVALVACGERMTTSPAAIATTDVSFSSASHGAPGAVFVSTNATAGNAVVAFARAGDGSLHYIDSYATGGIGIGGTADPLASQFALALSRDSRRLFVVNAGSNDVTGFTVDGARLLNVGRFDSQGTRPVSVAVGEHAVYVLNAGSNTVAGFSLQADGTLEPLAGSPWSLDAGAAGAAEVRLTRNGRVLVVTERASNTIETFVVGTDGTLSNRASFPSSGVVPFGFDFTPRGQVIVSEAASAAASSYTVGNDGALSLVSGSVSTNGQAAPCWLIVDNAGRFAWTANAGSSTLTGYAIAEDGTLARLDASGVTASLGAGAQPLDLDLTRDSRFLYVLKNGTGTLGVLRVEQDGRLTTLPDAQGLEAGKGYMGVAAY